MKPRRFVLLGSPVDHSASPAIHGAAFRALGIEADYVAREVGAEGVRPAMREAAVGGGGNVTAPHKERAASSLDRATEAVRATGACNCFWGVGGPGGAVKVAGDNTDVDGFLAAVEALLRPGGGGLQGARVLLLGAGGAARAVLHACLTAGAARVDVRNRTAARAEELARAVAKGDARVRVLPWDGWTDAPEAPEAGHDLVVNATSLGGPGSRGRPPAPERLGAAAAFDLVYAPAGTEWSRRAAASGMPAADGLEMLVQQAARSLQRWLPGVEPPVAAMRRSAREALAAGGAPGREATPAAASAGPGVPPEPAPPGRRPAPRRAD